MNKNNSLGKKLKNRRKELGLLQKEVASLLNIPVTRYANYESGYSKPPKKILVELENELKINLTQEISNYESDKEEIKIKNQYLYGYKYEIDQLIFFNELNWFRDYIDNINNLEIRRKLASDFSLILHELEEFSKAVTFNDYEVKDYRKEIKSKIDSLINEILDLIDVLGIEDRN